MRADRVQDSDGLYHCLDVGPNASHQEIRRAYRRLVPGAHPDVHPDDPEASRRFRELTHAYEILGDRYKRALYDRDRLSKGNADQPGGPASTPRWFGSSAWLRRAPLVTIGFPSPPKARPPLLAGPVRIQAAVSTESDPLLRALRDRGWL